MCIKHVYLTPLNTLLKSLLKGVLPTALVYGLKMFFILFSLPRNKNIWEQQFSSLDRDSKLNFD